MALELNRATFQRLVRFQLVCCLLAAVLAGLSMIWFPWPEFDTAFRTLLAEQFGRISPVSTFVVGLLIIPACGFWHVASLFGLLSFERWARTGYWASIAFGSIAGVALTGVRPVSYLTPLDGLFALISSAAFGMTLLLAYARGLGADWFTRCLVERKV